MLDRIGVDQPEWRALTSMEDIHALIDKVGFPVLVRPSYVLSGAAMNVCSNQEELAHHYRMLFRYVCSQFQEAFQFLLILSLIHIY